MNWLVRRRCGSPVPLHCLGRVNPTFGSVARAGFRQAIEVSPRCQSAGTALRSRSWSPACLARKSATAWQGLAWAASWQSRAARAGLVWAGPGGRTGTGEHVAKAFVLARYFKPAVGPRWRRLDVEWHGLVSATSTRWARTAVMAAGFRDLDMPLDQIRSVLAAPDLRTRNRLIAAHLTRLEQDLARTQATVASLRDLLTDPPDVAPITHRRVAATTAAAMTEVVGISDLLPWYLGALGELHATLEARGVRPSGPAGAVSATGLFSDEKGEATVFVPAASQALPALPCG